MPQVPQFVVLDVTSLQAPSQSPWPVGQMQPLCQQV
jgi:hypothetical protein